MYNSNECPGEVMNCDCGHDCIHHINGECTSCDDCDEFWPEKLPMTLDISDNIPPRMDVKEFVELGYLQELNRRFLYPLGLGMTYAIPDEDDPNQDWYLSSVIDVRDDPEGIVYALSDSNDALISKAKFDYIESETKIRKKQRIAILGYWIQPVS